MRDKKIYLLYPNCCYCVYYMIQYKVISKKYKKEAVFLGKVLEYAAKAGNSVSDFRPTKKRHTFPYHRHSFGEYALRNYRRKS